MEDLIPLFTFLAGIAVGGVAVWVMQRSKIQQAFLDGANEERANLAKADERIRNQQEQISELKENIGELKGLLTAENNAGAQFQADIARLETQLIEERKQSQEKLALLESAEKKLTETFKSLSVDALKSSNDSFLTLAKTKLQPVEKSIEKFEGSIKKLETDRVGAYKGLKTQVEELQKSQRHLNKETANLVSALRSPNVRGRWGEVQLKRVVELAGMLDYCDFREQQSQATDDTAVRPDLLVQLPAGKNVVVDSKVPLSSYLDALEAKDEATREEKLSEYAKSVRSHVQQLGKKAYFEHFDPSPEFVVLFIASEAFFSAALQKEPSLIEEGAKRNVIIATPTTLIALLRAVAYGWREEQLAKNAQDISKLGKELYKRIATVTKHVIQLGKGLKSTTETYNKFVGSFESRVLVTARRFEELQADVKGQDIESVEPVDAIPREVQSRELLPKSTERIETDQLPIH